MDADLDLYSVSHYVINLRQSDAIFTQSFQLTSLKLKDGSMDLKLSLKQSLKQTSSSHVTGVVEALDKGQPPLSGLLAVNVTIVKSSHSTPKFDKNLYRVSIKENAVKSTVVVRMNVKTADNSSVQFGIQHNYTQHFPFKIGIKTGLIVLNGSVDYERRSGYLFHVVATAYGRMYASSSARVEVALIDVNDVTPGMKLVTLTGNNSKAVLKEHTAPGTFVSYLHVSDQEAGDNGKTSCMVHSNQFTLDASLTSEDDYVLKSAVEFDREETSHYKVVIECQDFGTPSLSAQSSLGIEILDINDNVPRFNQSEYKIELMVGSGRGDGSGSGRQVDKPLLKVHAFDLDYGQNAALTYHLKHPNVSASTSAFYNDDVLYIDELDGSIYSQRSFHFERDSKEHAFVLLAVDSGEAKLTGTAILSVKVRESNDDQLKFESNQYVFTTSLDHVIVGAVFGRVKAIDNDQSDSNGGITYHSECKFVNVDHFSGVLSWRINNARNITSFNFSVFASNSYASKLRQASVPVIIKVLDNKLSVENVAFTFTGSVKPRGVLYKFKKKSFGSDLSIVSGNEKKLFMLNQSTGELLFADHLDSGVSRHNISVLFASPDASYSPFRRNNHTNIGRANRPKQSGNEGKLKKSHATKKSDDKDGRKASQWHDEHSHHNKLLLVSFIVNNTSNYAFSFAAWSHNSDHILTVAFAGIGIVFFLLLLSLLFCATRKCSKRNKSSKSFLIGDEKYKLSTNAFEGESKLLPEFYEGTNAAKTIQTNKAEADRRKEVKFSLVQMEDRDSKKNPVCQYSSLYKVSASNNVSYVHLIF